MVGIGGQFGSPGEDIITGQDGGRRRPACVQGGVATSQKGEAGQYVFQLGQLRLQTGKKDEAVALMKESFPSTGTSPRELSMLTMFYEQAGLFPEAEAAFNQAATVAKRPEDKAEYLIRAAELAGRRKDYAEAEAQIRAVLRDFSEVKEIRARANSSLLRLLEEQGKLGDVNIKGEP